ncbi:phage holin family protein [Burkholderia multivorans]|uniref:phage holin family protein n=1 Tax=Burkholderia multivorans TaxID=87883 RepID=UPI00345F09C2
MAHFSATRLADYATLAAIELEVARKSFLRDMVLYAVVGLSATFGLAFACMAAIVTAARTPYLTETAWVVAAFWILASIGSFITVRVSARRGSLSILREELQRDVQAIKESLR